MGRRRCTQVRSAPENETPSAMVRERDLRSAGVWRSSHPAERAGDGMAGVDPRTRHHRTSFLARTRRERSQSQTGPRTTFAAARAPCDDAIGRISPSRGLPLGSVPFDLWCCEVPVDVVLDGDAAPAGLLAEGVSFDPPSPGAPPGVWAATREGDDDEAAWGRLVRQATDQSKDLSTRSSPGAALVVKPPKSDRLVAFCFGSGRFLLRPKGYVAVRPTPPFSPPPRRPCTTWPRPLPPNWPPAVSGSTR